MKQVFSSVRCLLGACFLLVCLAALEGGGALAGPPMPLDSKAFEETISDEVNVSGIYVLGLMADDGPSNGYTKHIHLWIPPDASDRLCIWIRSVDARYNATGRFDISDTGQGFYRVDFSSDKKNIIRDYDHGELVLDAKVGRECARSGDLKHVPASWSSFDKQATWTIYVNSDGSDAFVLAPDKQTGEIIQYECSPLSIDHPQRAFSQSCLLTDVENIKIDEAWLELRRFGQLVSWEQLDISLPITP